MNKRISSLLLMGFVYSADAQSQEIKINEFVVDPKQDHNQDERISDSDEFFELFNWSFSESYNLTGWKFELVDATPETYYFDNAILAPRSFYVIQNPRGAQNNNGQLKLVDNFENLIDSVTYGNWERRNSIFDGNSSGVSDESLSRFPDGSINWIKTYATPGLQNITRQRIEPKLLIERVNEEGKEGLEIHAISFPPMRFVLQRSNNLKEWSDIYTNDVAEVSFSFRDSDFKNKQSNFYRVAEYAE